jgi:hypothetical protein
MRKTLKQAARSQERPGLPKANPSGLPYGTGSIQKRGRMFWAIYRDAEGRTVQENTKTEDADLARLFVAEKALVTARAKVAALEAIFDEAQKTGFAPTATGGWERTAGAGEPGNGGEHEGGSRPVRRDAGRRAAAKGKTTRGGKG